MHARQAITEVDNGIQQHNPKMNSWPSDGSYTCYYCWCSSCLASIYVCIDMCTMGNHIWFVIGFVSCESHVHNEEPI